MAKASGKRKVMRISSSIIIMMESTNLIRKMDGELLSGKVEIDTLECT